MNDTEVYPARYIGDGVYAHFDGWHVILKVPAESHMSGREQRIALEPQVILSLNAYWVEVQNHFARRQKEQDDAAKEGQESQDDST